MFDLFIVGRVRVVLVLHFGSLMPVGWWLAFAGEGGVWEGLSLVDLRG